MIKSRNKTVYYSPLAGRNFMTLTGACKAEARRMIYKKYPPEKYECNGWNGECDDLGFKGYFEEHDHYAHYDCLLGRLARMLKRRFMQYDEEITCD